MQTRLQEMAVLGNRLRQGRLMGMAEGSVIVDSLLESETDARSETRGRILGGAISSIDRSLGLVLLSEHHSVRVSAMIGKAINGRFHTYDRGTKRGVATPKRDNFIDLSIHSRYRNNLVRYVRVVQAISVRESPRELMDRLALLETQLLDPQDAQSAAVDLEAIGPEALPALRGGLTSSSSLVRFAASEALAYLNEEEAVEALVESARSEPAFRWHALTALSAMTHTDAREGLASLLHERSDETRYGAFQALIDFNPRDPAVRGAVLNQVMSLHHVPSDAESLVHIRRSKRPEIVMFGNDFTLKTPSVMFAGKRILVKSDGKHRLKVTYFSLGKDNETEFCDNELGSLIKTLIKVGGSYSDVVAAITDAKQKGALSARVKFDALPRPGREYFVEDEIEELPEGIDPDAPDDSEDVDDLGDLGFARIQERAGW